MIFKAQIELYLVVVFSNPSAQYCNYVTVVCINTEQTFSLLEIIRKSFIDMLIILAILSGQQKTHFQDKTKCFCERLGDYWPWYFHLGLRNRTGTWKFVYFSHFQILGFNQVAYRKLSVSHHHTTRTFCCCVGSKAFL